MNNNRFKKLTTLVISGVMTMSVAGTAMAETMDVNIEDCVNLAMANNHTIRSAIDDYDSAVWARHIARRQHGPTLNWNSAARYVDGYSYNLGKFYVRKYCFCKYANLFRWSAGGSH